MSKKHINIFKKILSLIIGSIYFCIISYATAATCQPPFNGNWVVPANCTYPTGGIKVYGNITVGTRIITVPTGAVLGIDLSSKKVTFSTGKMLFSGTAKMDNSVSTRNFVTVAYTASSVTTSCPANYSIVNTAGTAFQGGTVTAVSSSGNIKCGRD